MSWAFSWQIIAFPPRKHNTFLKPHHVWCKASWKRGTESDSKGRKAWWCALRDWKKQRRSWWQVADASVTGPCTRLWVIAANAWIHSPWQIAFIALFVTPWACSIAHSSQIRHLRSIDWQIWWATAVSSLWICRRLRFQLSHHLSLLPLPLHPFFPPAVALFPCTSVWALRGWASRCFSK